MSITRIGPKTTTSLQAIKDALIARRESKSISELTIFQTLDALKEFPKGSGKNSLRGRISTLQDETKIPNLKDSLIDFGIATGTLRGDRTPRFTEDSQSATQVRDQFQKFEMVLAGNLDGITIVPLSALLFDEFGVKGFLKNHMDTLLDDPRKIPLFYTPQSEMNFSGLGLETGEIAELRLYLGKRDSMLQEHTLEVNDDSRAFFLDDLQYLRTEDFMTIVNREIASPIKTLDALDVVVNEVNGSRIRFDIIPHGRAGCVSSYLTFKELQANFSKTSH